MANKLKKPIPLSLFLLVFIYGLPARADRVSPFKEKAQALIDKFSEPKSIIDLTGGNFETFSVPNPEHDQGHRHSAIYKWRNDGLALLIKTSVADERAYLPENQFRAGLEGVLIGERSGGPHVTRAGRFVDQSGHPGFFVEMEELFSGESKTFTFKGLRKNGKGSTARITTEQWQQVAQLLRKNLELGVDIDSDADLLFSVQSNQVRWIDTTTWHLSAEPIESEQTLENYSYFLTIVHKDSANNGRVLFSHLTREILSSSTWSSDLKNKIITNFKNQLLYRWNWPKDDVQVSPCEQALGKSSNLD